MAKSVKFNNNGQRIMLWHNGPVNNRIIGVPACFDNGYDGHAKVVLLDNYCMLFEDGRTDSKPLMYFRHIDVAKNKYRFGNIIELGDGTLDVQKGALHAEASADSNTPIDVPYGVVCDDPYTLGFESKGKVKVTYTEDYVETKEGDYLELTAYPWEGFTVYDHQSIYDNCACIFQPCTYYGVLDGKPVVGLGSMDRLCMKQTNAAEGFGGVPLAYIAMSVMGIREDGRREYCFINLGLSEGARTAVAYKIDGEDAIFTDKVEMEADWRHLPYVDDDTCTFENATFRFANKEIHFKGKWGTKGFLNKPRLEKHGQSQIFGTWYEGKQEYKHRIYYTFSESMEAYGENLKKYGFDVID